MVDRSVSSNFQILIAEDDPDDRFLLNEAFGESKLKHQLVFLQDGKELIDYLATFKPEDLISSRTIVMLDLNMPKMNGYQVLEIMKQDMKWKLIPIIIFSTTTQPEDILKTYTLGANSYITKPKSYTNLLQVVHLIEDYWFRLNQLPS